MKATNYPFQDCRSIGHAWAVDQAERAPRGLVFTRRLVVHCNRCQMQRVDSLTSRGDVIQRQYRQPEGYRIRAEETPKRAEFRRAMVERLLKEGVA